LQKILVEIAALTRLLSEAAYAQTDSRLMQAEIDFAALTYLCATANILN